MGLLGNIFKSIEAGKLAAQREEAESQARKAERMRNRQDYHDRKTQECAQLEREAWECQKRGDWEGVASRKKYIAKLSDSIDTNDRSTW